MCDFRFAAKPDWRGITVEEWLKERYEQLKQIHERLEDAIAKANSPKTGNWAPLFQLQDEVRLMRDAAKQEFDSF